jgi:regulator of protease activity HflC (stomatin/prohibitin superfamily)
MSGALTWLNDLMVWLGRFIPRLLLIPPTHRGVRFGPRGGTREIGPGLIIYWPITHQVLLMPVTTQSIQLSSQLLQCTGPSDRIVPWVTVVAAAIQFRVVKPIEAATRALSLHALVDNRASAALAKHFVHDLDASIWLTKASEELRIELQAYGVTLERLDITQFGTGVALKNLSDWSYADSIDGKHVLTV